MELKIERPEQIVFEKLKFGLTSRIPGRDFKIHTDIDMAVMDIIVRVEYYVLGKVAENEKVTVSVHKDWWEGFKDAWMPQWFKRQYPVKLREIVTMTVYRICPHVNASRDADHYFFLASGYRLPAPTDPTSEATIR